MARWFRSEPMEFVSLIVNEDAAHDCLADLGKLGVIQFSDVSSTESIFGFCCIGSL
jgi:V-type H+-transporting ATPase subunit a